MVECESFISVCGVDATADFDSSSSTSSMSEVFGGTIAVVASEIPVVHSDFSR